HLQEIGDPRGEFIALQLAKLARKPTPAATRKERALLRANQTAWLGPLAGTVSVPDSVWARGFLDIVVAELAYDTPADPSWNPVRVRHVTGVPAETRVVGAGCFGGLIELRPIAFERLGDVLGKRKPPLESLAIEKPVATKRGVWAAKHHAAIERLRE